jgi:hypothetical protein
VALDLEHSSQRTVIWFPIAASLSNVDVGSVMGFLQLVPASSESAPPCQGPLAPRALPRFHATTDLSDSPASSACLMDFDTRLASPGARPAAGASQVPGGSFCARCLLSPRRVQPVHLVEACGLMLASPLLEGWPLSATFNEAESSSRITTARAFASSGSDWQACSRPPRVRLHGSRPFTMTNTFSLLEPPSLLGAPEGNERNKGCN